MPSYVLGTEGLVASIRTYLDTNLSAKLAAVDARYSATIGLVDITEWRWDDPLSGRLPDTLPVGWVFSPQAQVEQWGDDADFFLTPIVVWVLIQDQDAEVLRRKMYRTCQAIWEVLKDGHYDQGITWQVLDAPVMDYSAIQTGPQDFLLADGRVRVQMTTREVATP